MGCGGSSVKITSKQGTKLSEIKDKIMPLDLILFRGAEFVSDAISLLEKISLGSGEWTHVGIAVTTDILPIKNGVVGKIYIWESTMSGNLGDGVFDAENNKSVFGVQIRDLEKVIDKYDNSEKSRIGWGQLISNPLIKKPEESVEIYNKRYAQVKDNLYEFYTRYNNITYDYNCCNLCSTMFPKCTYCRKNVFGSSDKLFCSELVAKVYQLVGLIDKNINPEEIAPIELIGFTNDNINKPIKTPVITITREWKQV